MTESTVQPDVGSLLAGIFLQHQVADLTLPLDETLPCTWPGHMPFRATVWTWFADRPGDPQPVHPRCGGEYQTRWLVVDEHTGTHMDAPSHFVPPPGSGLLNAGPAGAISAGDVPLLTTSGPAAVIDVRGLDGQAAAGQSPAITPEHVTGFESRHGPLRGGDVAGVPYRLGCQIPAGPGRCRLRCRRSHHQAGARLASAHARDGQPDQGPGRHLHRYRRPVNGAGRGRRTGPPRGPAPRRDLR